MLFYPCCSCAAGTNICRLTFSCIAMVINLLAHAGGANRAIFL